MINDQLSTVSGRLLKVRVSSASNPVWSPPRKRLGPRVAALSSLPIVLGPLFCGNKEKQAVRKGLVYRHPQRILVHHSSNMSLVTSAMMTFFRAIAAPSSISRQRVVADALTLIHQFGSLLQVGGADPALGCPPART